MKENLKKRLSRLENDKKIKKIKINEEFIEENL